MNAIERKIINIISYNSRITFNEISLYLNISNGKVNYYIGKLKLKNIIKMLGNKRNGVWVVENIPIKID